MLMSNSVEAAWLEPITAQRALGQAKMKPRIERFAAQRVIARSITAADDDGNFRHAAVGNRVDQFRPGSDDARLLGIPPHHKAVHILQKQDRRPSLVAVHHKAGGFLGGVVIDHAAELQPRFRRMHRMMLARDHAHRKPAQLGVSANQRAAVLGLVFLKTARIDQAIEHVSDFIRASAD